jgi:hypothetical protein
MDGRRATGGRSAGNNQPTHNQPTHNQPTHEQPDGNNQPTHNQPAGNNQSTVKQPAGYQELWILCDIWRIACQSSLLMGYDCQNVPKGSETVPPLWSFRGMNGVSLSIESFGTGIFGE